MLSLPRYQAKNGFTGSFHNAQKNNARFLFVRCGGFGRTEKKCIMMGFGLLVNRLKVKLRDTFWKYVVYKNQMLPGSDL